MLFCVNTKKYVEKKKIRETFEKSNNNFEFWSLHSIRNNSKKIIVGFLDSLHCVAELDFSAVFVARPEKFV